MKRKGICIRCGACCNIFNFPPTFRRNPEIAVDEDGWCILLNRQTMLCTIYPRPGEADKRPRICRMFPRGSFEIDMLPQCTYYFEEAE